MKIINLTPHPVNLINLDGTITTFPVSGEVARINVNLQKYRDIFVNEKKVILYKKEFGMPSYVPPNEMPDVYYIVSSIYQNALSYRTDLLIPDEIVRDEDGNIIGCKSFSF